MTRSKWPPQNIIQARRGEPKPKVLAWQVPGEESRRGAYSFAVYRMGWRDEPPLVEFDGLTVEPTEAGAHVSVTLSEADLASVQGPPQSSTAMMYARLFRDGAEIYGALFLIMPPAVATEAAA